MTTAINRSARVGLITDQTGPLSFMGIANVNVRQHVNAGDLVAHYTEGYKTFDGLAFPTRRRVYRRNPDSTPDRSVTPITLDIHDITAA